MAVCKNCNNSFEGKFCPNCSQKADTHRLTVGHLLHDLNHAVTHTDKGIFFLIKEMFIRPGVVASEYAEGKRKKYFNPLTFLLLMMAAHLFVTKKTDFYGHYLRELRLNYAMNQTDPASVKAFEKSQKNVSVLTENDKLTTIILLPLMSFMSWLFFRRSGYNYAENLIFTVLVNGQLLLIFVLLCIIPVLINVKSVTVVMQVYAVLTWIYFIFAYKQFFGQKWGWTILKGLTIQLLYFGIMGALSFLAVQFM